MKPNELLVRCLLLKEEGQWVALCLDFSLAAQSSSQEQAKRQLISQIESYVNDALSGADVAHAPVLLRRRAPFKYWVMYFIASCVHHIGNHKLVKAFRQPLPLRTTHA